MGLGCPVSNHDLRDRGLQVTRIGAGTRMASRHRLLLRRATDNALLLCGFHARRSANVGHGSVLVRTGLQRRCARSKVARCGCSVQISEPDLAKNRSGLVRGGLWSNSCFVEPGGCQRLHVTQQHLLHIVAQFLIMRFAIVKSVKLVRVTGVAVERKLAVSRGRFLGVLLGP